MTLDAVATLEKILVKDTVSKLYFNYLNPLPHTDVSTADNIDDEQFLFLHQCFQLYSLIDLLFTMYFDIFTNCFERCLLQIWFDVVVGLVLLFLPQMENLYQ